jgi:hypothetical protein
MSISLDRPLIQSVEPHAFGGETEGQARAAAIQPPPFSAFNRTQMNARL